MDMYIENDNIKICYNIYGSSGEWLIIANAPGMSNHFFNPIIKLLKERFKILIWDYRGISPSGDVKDKTKLEILHHAEDLHIICKANNIEYAHLMGWCIGPKVIIEFYAKHPEICKTFTFLNFSYNVFEDWDEVTNFDMSIRRVSKILKEKPEMGKKLINLIKEMQTSNYDTLLNIIDGIEDKESVLNLINSLDEQSNISDLSLNKFRTDRDVINYFIIYNNFINYYCIDLIKSINIPTLIFGGGNDTWTPIRALTKLSKMIKNSTLYEVDDATHYLLLEHPHVVAQQFLKFIHHHDHANVFNGG